jgi:hypothetical protein
MSKPHFGTVRRRSSGRWQASYRHDGRVRNAPQTFATKSDALAFLSITEADIHRGAWIDPRAGKVSVSAYANEWLERRLDLAVRTTELYRYLLDSHILPELGTVSRAGHASANAALRYQHATQDRDRVLAEALAELSAPAAVVPIERAQAKGTRPDRAQAPPER